MKEEHDWVTQNFDKVLAEHGYVREGHYYRAEKANEDTLVFFCHFGVSCVLISYLLSISPLVMLQNFCAALHGNGVNVLAMGAFYVAPQMGCDIADAYLNAELGTGYEWWHNFYEFHKLAIDELEAFNYEEYKKNGFKVKHLGDYDLTLETKPE